ncbi:MAG: GGDEF domain-containing protein [Lachnospiraceae bacterium]|nr:GGDEF domain-containing protein [Lachnospiraceae bacterium]
MNKKRIAIFGNGWTNGFYKSVLEGVMAEAEKENVDVFAFVSYVLWDRTPQNLFQLNMIDVVRPEEFDGAILLTNTMNAPEEHDKVVALFGAAGVPMISLEVRLPGIPYIGTENYNGMCELVTHLATEHGVKKVVYVRGIEGHPEDAIRQQALKDTVAKYGMELLDIIDGDFGYYISSENTQKWIDDGRELPDAFICANDHTAIGVMSALNKNGIDVPGQVKVTGFDCIDEGRVTFPMLATITRGWDRLGTYAYLELKRQMEHPDPDYEAEYESSFVPSESCGCEASPQDSAWRMNKVRSVYTENIQRVTFDSYFQDMTIAAGKTDGKEEFQHTMGEVLNNYNFLGDNFWLCTEPELFELEDNVYTHWVKGYSEELDVIFWKKEGMRLEPFRFKKHDMVPGYAKIDNESHLYVFSPLNYQDFLIGYVVIKDDPSMVYSQELRRWVTNMDNVFMAMRQNIFTLKANKRLREIYMTDFLTGIYNRTGCEDVLFGFIETQKKKGLSTILLFADIDRMKLINDNYGHLEGDLAIRATAGALKASCPSGFLFGRYGGDEFVAVGNYEGKETAEEFCLKITENIKGHIERLHVRFPLSVSVGGQIITPDQAGDVKDYIDAADRSMYDRKEEAHRRLDVKFKAKDGK